MSIMLEEKPFFMWKNVEQSLIVARFDEKYPLIKQKYPCRNI